MKILWKNEVPDIQRRAKINNTQIIQEIRSRKNIAKLILWGHSHTDIKTTERLNKEREF